MAFKLRSGNTSAFKSMGSSPLQRVTDPKDKKTAERKANQEFSKSYDKTTAEKDESIRGLAQSKSKGALHAEKSGRTSKDLRKTVAYDESGSARAVSTGEGKAPKGWSSGRIYVPSYEEDTKVLEHYASRAKKGGKGVTTQKEKNIVRKAQNRTLVRDTDAMSRKELKEAAKKRGEGSVVSRFLTPKKKLKRAHKKGKYVRKSDDNIQDQAAKASDFGKGKEGRTKMDKYSGVTE